MTKGDLITKVINAAYSAYTSMVNAGISCAIFGHTTQEYGSLARVIGIASNNLPIDNGKDVNSGSVLYTPTCKSKLFYFL
jgi:hypothetical protein